MDKSQLNTIQTNEGCDNQSYDESKLTTDIDNATISNLRKDLAVSKILISDLKENLKKEKQQRNQLEVNLNEAIKTIKSLHREYSQLSKTLETYFNESHINSLNQEVASLRHELMVKNKDLKELNDYYINKIHQLNNEIQTLKQKLSELERQSSLDDDDDAQATLIVENQKLIKDNKKLNIYIDKLKKDIFNLENINKDTYEKMQMKDNEILKQKEKIDSIVKENQKLTNKINKLYELNKLNTNKVIKLQKQRRHFEGLILKKNQNYDTQEEEEDIEQKELQLSQDTNTDALSTNRKTKEKMNRLNCEIDSLKDQIEKLESKIFTEYPNKVDTSVLLMSTIENEDYSSTFSN